MKKASPVRAAACGWKSRLLGVDGSGRAGHGLSPKQSKAGDSMSHDLLPLLKACARRARGITYEGGFAMCLRRGKSNAIRQMGAGRR